MRRAGTVAMTVKRRTRSAEQLGLTSAFRHPKSPIAWAAENHTLDRVRVRTRFDVDLRVTFFFWADTRQAFSTRCDTQSNSRSPQRSHFQCGIGGVGLVSPEESNAQRSITQ